MPWNANNRDPRILAELRGVLVETINVAHHNPAWWEHNVRRNRNRNALVRNFLNWYLNDRLPADYTDQRGRIAIIYLERVLNRFYDNPTLLLPTNSTIDPDVRRLRPSGPPLPPSNDKENIQQGGRTRSRKA